MSPIEISNGRIARFARTEIACRNKNRARRDQAGIVMLFSTTKMHSTENPPCETSIDYPATGIFPIRFCHSTGPVLCTDSPLQSTATVTGIS